MYFWLAVFKYIFILLIIFKFFGKCSILIFEFGDMKFRILFKLVFIGFWVKIIYLWKLYFCWNKYLVVFRNSLVFVWIYIVVSMEKEGLRLLIIGYLLECKVIFVFSNWWYWGFKELIWFCLWVLIIDW